MGGGLRGEVGWLVGIWELESRTAWVEVIWQSVLLCLLSLMIFCMHGARTLRDFGRQKHIHASSACCLLGFTVVIFARYASSNYGGKDRRVSSTS